MRKTKAFGGALAALLLFVMVLPAPARSRKGDKLYKEGQLLEQKKEWDKALELYQKALQEDPSDAAYQMALYRVRFQAAQAHVDRGQKLRQKGNLVDALAAFQKAFALDPSSMVAEQELKRTSQMIEREKQKAAKPGAPAPKPEDAGMTPGEAARREMEERVAGVLAPPELRPLSRQISTLKMNNQPPKVLFETVGKLAGINVVFDPEYQPTPGKNFNIDLNNTTLEEALDYLAVLTKSFWKPLSSNTVFITQDNVTKRRDYEDQVVRVFYLNNVNTVQELQEVATNVRSITDIRRLFTYNAQNAIVVRGSVDQVALAEKLIHDLDKPKSEVVIDVVVMEANRSRTRDLAATVASAGNPGIKTPVSFAPRTSVTTTKTEDGENGGSGGDTTAGAIRLSQFGKLSSADWSVTLPGALIQAIMSDRSTRVLQSPQVRAVDNQKATLKIGDRYPYATGSFQPGIGAVGVSPLVSTQFQFAEVGVNVDITPRVHMGSEVSLHVELEISSVRDRIDVGGLSQPVIGQRRVIHDIRIKEGEVNVLGGLMQAQDNKTVSGVPGLASIPVIKRLFSSENVEKNTGELMVVLIPHIVRSPDVNEVNLRGVAAGNDQVVKLNYAPRPGGPPALPVPPQPPVTAPVPPAAAPKPAAPAAAGEQRLGFSPPAVDVQLGGTFTVSVVLENARNIFTAPMKFKFDPRILRLTEITRGPLLGGDGQQVTFTRNILNDTGDASINLNRLPGAGGVNGSGALVTLTFQAGNKGTTSVTIPEITLRDSQLQPVNLPTPALTVNVK